MKTWDYRTQTEGFEKTIQSLRGGSAGTRTVRANWAYGAYLAWSSVTTGWQEDGDDARLRALAEALNRLAEEA